MPLCAFSNTGGGVQQKEVQHWVSREWRGEEVFLDTMYSAETVCELLLLQKPQTRPPPYTPQDLLCFENTVPESKNNSHSSRMLWKEVVSWFPLL